VKDIREKKSTRNYITKKWRACLNEPTAVLHLLARAVCFFTKVDREPPSMMLFE